MGGFLAFILSVRIGGLQPGGRISGGITRTVCGETQIVDYIDLLADLAE